MAEQSQPLRLTSRVQCPGSDAATLTLPFEVRQKSRFRATLDDGRVAGVVLDRGAVLRNGDGLAADDGTRVRVLAAAEPVTTAHATDAGALAAAAYHLGNRHMPLQVGDGWLRWTRDHVLDAMVAALGLRLVHEDAPFEPLGGAYAGHHHSHD